MFKGEMLVREMPLCAPHHLPLELNDMQRVRDFGELSPPSAGCLHRPPSLKAQESMMCKGRQKSLKARGCRWLQGNRIFVTQQYRHTYELKDYDNMHKTLTALNASTEGGSGLKFSSLRKKLFATDACWERGHLFPPKERHRAYRPHSTTDPTSRRPEDSVDLSMLWFCFGTICNYLSFSPFSFFFFLSVFISLFDFYFLFRGGLFF